MEDREYCDCGEEMDRDCFGEPRCPVCDPPCPGCYDGGGPGTADYIRHDDPLGHDHSMDG